MKFRQFFLELRIYTYPAISKSAKLRPIRKAKGVVYYKKEMLPAKTEHGWRKLIVNLIQRMYYCTCPRVRRGTIG